MKYIKSIATIVSLLFSLNVYASPEVFFKEYVSLGDNFDSSVATLYSDNAKIHSYRVYPHGLERSMELSGAQWKELVVQTMPLAKSKNDLSQFSDIEYVKTKSGFKIKANRYSVRKCYIDKGYFMVIERTLNKEYQIIEEYMETQPQSNCVLKSDDLAQLLTNAKNQIEGHLPLMVDEETRLDSVIINSDTFYYIYTLVTVAPGEFTSSSLTEIAKPANLNSTCNMQNLKPLIEAGATLAYTYKDKTGQEITTMMFNKGHCG